MNPDKKNNIISINIYKEIPEYTLHNSHIYCIDYKLCNYRNYRIARYINIGSLMSILRGKMLIRKRYDFPDLNECGEFNFPFKYHIEEKDREQYNVKLTSIRDYNKRFMYIPTVCFTRWNGYDSRFFWDSYLKNNDGVCIITTIHDFIYSINRCNKNLYIGKINYVKEPDKISPIREPFTKLIPYKQEQEYRIYIEDFSQNKIQPNYIAINPELYIHKIILSPKMGTEIANKIKENLIKQFPFLSDKFISSRIRESNK